MHVGVFIVKRSHVANSWVDGGGGGTNETMKCLCLKLEWQAHMIAGQSYRNIHYTLDA